MQRTQFSYKRLTSLLITWCFVALVLTGVVMFVNPPGRIANWTDWHLLGLNKEGWHSIHVLMAIVFLVGGLFHLLKFNWKVFLSHLTKSGTGKRRIAETPVSLAIFFVILLGSIASIPPFSSIMEFSESIKNSWEPETNNAPFPHMELQSLKEVVETMGMEVEKAIGILSEEGVEVKAAGDTLQEIAADNRTSPQQLYLTLDGATTPGKGRRSSVEVQIPGLGRMTIEEVVRRLGLDLEEVLARMGRGGVEADGKARIRDLAEEHNLSPHELVKWMKPED